MQRTAALASILTLVLAGCAGSPPASSEPSAPLVSNAMGAALDEAIANPARSPDNVARDAWRHPKETLSFFMVRPGQTVIEITPGGGWYAEILAPYLRDQGRYVAAVPDPSAFEAGRQRDYYANSKAELEAKFAAAPAQFDRATLVAYDPKAPRFGAPGSADVVLTFRNVHNWRMAGQAAGMFQGFFDVLRPGGVLGVVEHRANGDVPDDDKSGYVGQAQVIALAEAAGFRLDGQSEVNANPRDTKDHPNGVWMLPPVKRHDPEDAQKYMSIGESDRMTLRFVKPAQE
ncbi:methyltransferase [Luteimonas vadosa]|uniref:Class I SAM-dependent methyltransferase n=1 Tax=Luteimonas vadosa TaxID=1165507 RepID=A0ABP9DQ78_9GAMM